MSRSADKLTNAAIKNATTEGKAQRKIADGGGLTLNSETGIESAVVPMSR